MDVYIYINISIERNIEFHLFGTVFFGPCVQDCGLGMDFNELHPQAFTNLVRWTFFFWFLIGVSCW